MSRVRSVRAWGPITGPTACALAGRRCSLSEWRKGVPGGGAFHHCEGRLGSGAVPPPTACPLGGLLGSATHVLWVRVCGCGGPTLSPWPACPVGAACRGGGGGLSPGGWPATVVRGAWCQALSLPRPPVLWSGRPEFRNPCVPGAVGAGVGTQHRPYSVRSCGPALLAVGVAERVSPGGVSSTIVRGVWGQALSLPRLPAHWAGCWGPPPTCCGCGCVGVGAQHCPLGLHALWGLRATGVAGSRPRGGWPATVVRGAWCQALSLPRPPVLWSGRPGFCDPCVPGAVDAGVGTQHRPHSVRPCGPALLAVGVAEGRPRGGAFHHCEGRLRSGAVPTPTVRPLGRLLGSATHVLLAGVCGCGGPTLSPWPACPVRAACRGGGGGPSPGGGGVPPL